ncbi:M20/M25/M40 family metallo-hydrolase [Bacteroides faecichinchillae]|uniref:M20/M25/M40 family metallo-hydrolase n=1 Tax=Bacteroides faecichinchillae TaxID=871325 RepID=UPI0010A68E75|nr:M20/M25/M40 family metallo-hydrolase [Bacteroides faecichinchillae]THG69223.1 M20/M25/M40 family metallo-hydrolase [Bacteroides faecichinchillae]
MNMKKFFATLLILLFVLVLVLVVRTVTYKFGKVEKNVSDKELVNTAPSEQAIRRFVGGIRIPTISNEFYNETNFKPFDEFMRYLADSYPEVYRVMDVDTINKYGLVFHWKGKNSKLNPILFLSHYDVVPVAGYDPSAMTASDTIFQLNDKPLPSIQAYAEKWEYPPFSGAVANGRIYGRGTLDMKCMLFSLMEGARNLINEGFQPERDIWFAFGHDEEVSGHQGALKIANYFKEKGLHFDAVYDEGGIIAASGSAMEAIQEPLALVGVGEKGFLTLRLAVRGIGGHSSMPPAKSSLIYAAEIIEKLNSNQFPAQIISPITKFFDNVGGYMGFLSRMAIANQWLFEPLLLNTMEKSPASNALVRTTTAVTMAKGSDAPNVLASEAEVTVNFRILPGDSVAGVMEHVQKVCEGYDVSIDIISQREPSGISPENVRGFQIIKEELAEIYPAAIVTSYITIGGTDSYKYQIVSDEIYRFLPICLNQYEQRTIHNENEYISLENFGKVQWYFKEVMRNY